MGKHKKHKSRDASKERDRKRKKSKSHEESSEGELEPKKHRPSHSDSHKVDEEVGRESRRREEEVGHQRLTSYYGDVIEDEPDLKTGRRGESDEEGESELEEGEREKDPVGRVERDEEVERAKVGDAEGEVGSGHEKDQEKDRGRDADRERGRNDKDRDRDRGRDDRNRGRDDRERDRNDRERGREERDRPRERGREDRDREKGRDEKPRDRDRGHDDRQRDRDRDRDDRPRDRDRGRDDRDRKRDRDRNGDRERDRGVRAREFDRDRGGERRDRDEERNRGRGGDDDRDRETARNQDRNDDRGRNRDGDGTRGKDDYESRRRDRRDRDDHGKDRSRPENSSRSKLDQSKEGPTEDIQAKEQKPEPARQPTLGAYIPPAKLRMMQNAIEDKSSASYQRLAWEALKKSLNGLINKVNISNISVIVRELFKENLIRGRGILCRSIMQAQTASPTYTNVLAALVAIINTKFPNIGELLLKRLILQFRRGYKRNDKQACLSAVKFIAHLVNQQVAHEVLALELLTLLLEHPTAHSIEVAIAFLKEVGARLDEVSPKGAHAIFESLRKLLHEGLVEKRVQYMIEVMFQLRKDKYDKFPAVVEELDLVEEEDQFTHMITLDEEIDSQDILNIFKMDEEYIINEEKYAALRKEILDESEEESGDEDDEEDESDSEKANGEKADGTVEIFDKTETNLLALRRTIYLTIQSSLDYEECCHKLMKANLPEGQEKELCHMILDCCAQQRTYEKFFGLLAQRFCSINVKYVAPFEEIFRVTYDTVHRLDTNKLRNVAKFFAHLLFTDAISWTILEHIRLTEDDTTSSSRIFVKILCQELSEYMGLVKLNERFNEKTLKAHFEGLFPRDSPKNTRFSINFFTSIGLGGLTDELREHLKPKARPEP